MLAYFHLQFLFPQPNDPGPISSRSPTPEAEPPIKLDDNPDILKDKLREIIQTATGLCSIFNMQC